MKHSYLFFFVILLSITFISCENSVDNSVTFQNLASNDVFVNFKGDKIDVPNGATVTLTELFKGEYEYETIYEVPLNATDSETEGEVAGTFIINAGTDILVVYTSVLREGTYTLYASVTSSDDQTVDEDPNPIGP